MSSYPSLLADCRIGFIGAGNIALAIAQGLIKSGQIRPEQLNACAPTDRSLIKFKELGCFTTNTNGDLFANCPKTGTRIIFLCVKPHIFKQYDSDRIESLISMGKVCQTEGPVVVVSVIAGITLASIRSVIPVPPVGQVMVKFVRLMPNTAVSVGAGICGLSIEPMDANDKPFHDFLRSLFSPIGWCEFVTEQQLNAVCGLGGSGIAYVYTLIHALSDGGLKMGLPRSVATNIAAQTVLGAALMVQKTGENAIALRDAVTSPGGTTIHGLHELEKGGFNALLMNAVESATKRADQLS